MKKSIAFIFSLLLCGSMAFAGCFGNNDSSSSSGSSPSESGSTSSTAEENNSSNVEDNSSENGDNSSENGDDSSEGGDDPVILTPTESLTYEREGDAYTVTGMTGEETEIVIPATYEGLPVTKIAKEYQSGAFARTDITSVVIPDSIVEIGYNTFNNCDELVSVSIGESSALTTIGNNAFSGCGKLESIYIPAAVTLGDSVFNNCASITFTVAEESALYSSENGHLIDKATHTLLRAGQNGVVPEGVVKLETGAFRRGVHESVSLPASLVELGSSVFSNMENLKSFTVASGNTAYSAHDGILYDAGATEIVEVPKGITGEIALPATLTKIAGMDFADRVGLTAIRIPADIALTNIGQQAFRKLTVTIHYGGTQEQWDAIQKNSNWLLNATEVTVVCAE